MYVCVCFTPQKVDHKDKKKEIEKIRELKTSPGCPIAKYQSPRNREQRK